jgi:ubiquitin C-terminal hydrolase
MSYGHYTAYVKKDEWMKYDDQTVKRANVNGDNAYLVVYKRCDQAK